jgi:hypothetical protein
MSIDNISEKTAEEELTRLLYPVVARVIDSYNLVINRGSIDNIKEGDRFLIFETTEDIMDPVTGKSLGPLELSKGTGKAIEVFDRKAIIRSDRIRGMSGILAQADDFDLEPEKYLYPFKKPKVNDIAKTIE